MTAVAPSNAQSLRAALLWAGNRPPLAAGRSAGEIYGLEGVRAPVPEIVVLATTSRFDRTHVIVHQSDDRDRSYCAGAITEFR